MIKEKEFEFWRVLGSVYFSDEGSMTMTNQGVTHTCFFHIHKVSKEGNNALQIHFLNFGLILGVVNAKNDPPDHPVGYSRRKSFFLQLHRRTKQAFKSSLRLRRSL